MYEEGKLEVAEFEKVRIEELQRTRRKELEASGTPWVPKWFEKSVNDCWTSNEKYWKTREASKFDDSSVLW